MQSVAASGTCGTSRLSVAPMMDWTDRHCRYFHRQMSRHVLLYTEMVAAAALVRGGAVRLIGHDAAEHPLAVQLGGSDPKELAEAARICAGEGFAEINLNVGCPSDRVRSGCFGAVLMQRPELVAECCAAMIAAAPGAEVTVKCRIGIDDQVPELVLPAFLEKVAAAGIRRFTIHARKAWLLGLSPKENREIPPLDHELVVRMKRHFPQLSIAINGGIASLPVAQALLARGLDGAMLGRAAYHSPFDVLATADAAIWGAVPPVESRAEVVEAMRPYLARHLADGGKLHSVTRHMLGLFAAQPGARVWRRTLSDGAACRDAGLEVLDAAMAATRRAAQGVVAGG